MTNEAESVEKLAEIRDRAFREIADLQSGALTGEESEQNANAVKAWLDVVGRCQQFIDTIQNHVRVDKAQLEELMTNSQTLAAIVAQQGVPQ